MEVGIVGLPGAGKTTLFNALSGLSADPFGQKPNVGIAKIPDPRLERITQFIPTQKVIHATLQLVDLPGVAPGGAGGGSGGSGGAEKLNAFLSHVRTVDAVLHVVRCFDDGRGAAGIRPAHDLETMETELVLADFVVAESAKEKAGRAARAGDRETRTRLAVLEKATAALEEGMAIRAVPDWTDEERLILRSYGMISAKPVLYVANVEERSLPAGGDYAAEVRKAAAARGAQAVVVCAKLEAELRELSEADRQEMLAPLGLEEPALGPLARAAHETLGLSTFYTAGEKEVRAWPIPAGASAPEAAGAIHSDIQRGFIRAECYHVEDLFQHRTERAIKDAGKLRSEGKTYAMRDGDVVHFLFNV